MGKIFAGTFVSMDGVMQAPGGPDEDRDSGFTLGGWTAPYWTDPAMGPVMDEQMGRGEALLLGRTTYDIFAKHWPRVGDEDPAAKRLNAMKKYVASRTLKTAAWNNSELLGPDFVSEVKRIKALVKGEIHVTGSHGLLQSLFAADLVDALSLWVFPVVLGTGKRLFETNLPAAFTLTGSRTFTSGIVVNHYARAGEVKTGSFQLPD